LVVLAVGVLMVGALMTLLVRMGTRDRAARRRHQQHEAMDLALASFVERVVEAGSIEQVAAATVAPLGLALGVQRVVLLWRSGNGWSAQIAGTRAPADAPPAGTRPVLKWLARNPEPVFIDALADRRYGALRAPIGELAARYYADVLLPLAHRGELVGVLALMQRPYSKPYRDDERAFLAHLHLEAAAAAANAALLHEVALRTSLEREVDLAQALQRELVPERTEAALGGVRLAGHTSTPGDAAGSNFWTHHKLANERVLVLVGDVAGDGLGASMMLAVTLGACDALCSLDPVGDVGRLLEQLNQALYRTALRAWVTCCAALFDRKQRTVTFANAGHPFPYHVTGSGGQAEVGVLVGTGLAVGDRPDSTYAPVVRPFVPGDVFLFYTRGLVERTDAEGKPYGDRRLQRALRSAAAQELDAPKLRDKLLDDLSTWSGGVGARYDEVMLVVRTERE